MSEINISFCDSDFFQVIFNPGISEYVFKIAGTEPKVNIDKKIPARNYPKILLPAR